MIRVAAVGDVHFAADVAGSLRPQLALVHEEADVLLLAGDLTRLGRPEEAEVLAQELADVQVPIIAVLGNHDLHANRDKEIVDVLAAGGVRVLEGEAVRVDVDGYSLGVAGVKGFGVGFPGASASDFGEPEMKAFVATARHAADRLRAALEALDTDRTVALTHYSPVEGTLQGERLEIWPFLGSYLLAEAIDAAGADLAVHGHAHRGTEKGMTPGGVHVRNVAQAVIRSAYRVYCLTDRDGTTC
ncbi:MAG: Metallophosphoesterase [Acidimicrobiales bacterium]|nr:Metallophosphoesterase [Acidimicrobiales bacterium]